MTFWYSRVRRRAIWGQDLRDSGEVVEVNEELETTPEAINEDPYGNGWICKIRLESEEPSKLLDAQEYRSLIGD